MLKQVCPTVKVIIGIGELHSLLWSDRAQVVGAFWRELAEAIAAAGIERRVRALRIIQDSKLQR